MKLLSSSSLPSHVLSSTSMRLSRGIVALAVSLSTLALFAMPAHADTTTDTLKSTLQKKLGDQATVSDVRKSPISGLYEVTIGKQIVYTDSTARYLVAGDIRDTTTGEDLTQARVDALNRIDFASLPLQDAVKVVRGNGKRKIAVFSDPTCPYCRRLEETLQSVDNVTVYTFLYPILSANSVPEAKQIWCSSDKGKAWEDWMVLRTPLSGPKTCTNADDVLKRNIIRGKQMDVTGTPTVFLANGNRLPGAVPADELEKAIEQTN